jgi:hypothetical protein
VDLGRVVAKATSGVEFDMLLLMIAGVAAVVAGGAAIWFGIPVKEFSFGNTMILAGVVAICSGLLMVGLGLVVRELKAIKLSLRERALDSPVQEIDGPPLPAGSITATSGRQERGRFRPAASDRMATAGSRGPPADLRDDEAGASGQNAEHSDVESGNLAPEVAPPVPPPAKARRNLLFSSSRKEREGGEPAAKSPGGDPSVEPALAADAGKASQPHPSFNDTWPRVERSPRADPATSCRDAALAPPLQTDRRFSSRQDTSAATVVKSGTVDGMSYSLYSDGSIEAQMPEGMMRFASIEELRTHIDRTR